MAGFSSVLLGVGGGGLNTCTNALVSVLYGANRGRMLNLLGIFFGVGALLVPSLGAAIEGSFAPQQLLALCAVLPALCAVVYAALRFPVQERAQNGFSWRDTARVARYRELWLIAFILVFESGNEACIGGWTSTFASTVGLSSRTATLILSGYWAALMLSRIVAAWLLRTSTPERLVATAAAIAIVGGGALLSASSAFWLSTGAVLVGLSYGPIFPTTLAIAGERYSQMTGTVFGVLFSIALVGGMTFPWGVGQISQHSSVRTGMLIPVLGAAGICSIAMALMRHSKVDATSKSSSAELGS
jgi:fucose permease